MKVKIILFFALLSAAANGQVRQPHSLYFLETIPQVSQMNPAFQPRVNSYVMVPNGNIDFLSDLAVKDILQKQGNRWYTPVEKQYSYNKLHKSIGKKATMFNVGADLDILGFGFRAGNGYFSFGISEHAIGNFALPSDLFKITDKGFPDNTNLDFSPLRVQGIVYKQFLIGYSTKVDDRLSIGVNVKPLSGQFAVATKIDRFKLQTGKEQWELDARGNVYSSLPIEEVIIDAEGKIKDINFRDVKDYEIMDWVRKYGTTLNNLGIALDLGAAYQINERLAVSASLNNLGFISWKEDLNGITFDGKYTFNGLHYDTSKDDDLGDLLSNLADSIADALNYTVHHDKFKTMLPPVFNAGATYQLSRAVSAGFLSRTTFWQKGIRQSFNASVNLQPYSFVSLNAGATWQVKGNLSVGGGFMFLIGPMQLYLLVDVPVRYSALTINDKRLEIDLFNKKRPIPIPEHMKFVTGRLGLNFVFGRHGYVNKPMLDKGRSSWN